ncbi:MAG: PAS domain S-box protein, partial [Dehalococcoidia bacterium]
AMCRIIGYSKDEMMGMNNRQFMDIESAKKAYQAFKRVYTAGKHAEEFGWEIWRKDGTKRFIEASVSLKRNSEGAPIGFRGIVHDITERRQMEEALLLKEKAIENSVSAIAMSDMEGRITYLNQACMKFWGEACKEELLGKPYWFLLKSDDVVKDIATAMFENDAWEGELIAARKNGEEVLVQVSAGMVRDEHGNPIQTISSFLDITELKRLEEEKQRMEEQLQIAGRLAAVGELAAGVAHELNNPLAAVQAFAQFLSSRKDLDESMRSDVETIYREAQRASRITANLLSFARRHEPEKRFISINEVVQKSLELHAYSMKVNNLEVITELAPELPNTMADFYQIQQVFVNIITNAEQAMTEAHGKGKLVVKTQTTGEVIQIAFADDGPGIPEEDLKRIFDPFYTTKDVGRGTGLGLSICFGLVEQHSGRIFARSKLGEGTTFFVEIPAVSEAEFVARYAGSTQ